jgi:hypothetical protein
MSRAGRLPCAAPRPSCPCTSAQPDRRARRRGSTERAEDRWPRTLHGSGSSPMMSVASSTLALCTRTPVRIPSTRTADASPIDKTSKAVPKPTPCAFCRVFRARVLSRTAAKFRLEDSSISAVAEPVRLLSPGAPKITCVLGAYSRNRSGRNSSSHWCTPLQSRPVRRAVVTLSTQINEKARFCTIPIVM